MSAARPEFPYPCKFKVKSRDEISRRGDVKVRSHGYK